jgi:hypothetical protein
MRAPEAAAGPGVVRPPRVPYCLQGLRSFVVVQRSDWGYWAGPIRPAGAVDVDLLIEKYAGTSIVAVRRHGS